MTAGVQRTARRFGALAAVLATALTSVALMALPSGAVTASPTQLEFGRVAVGSVSEPKTIDVHIDEGELYEGAYAINDAEVVSDGCDRAGGLVGPADCKISVRFRPQRTNTTEDVAGLGRVTIVTCSSRFAPNCPTSGYDFPSAEVAIRGVAAPKEGFRKTLLAATCPQRVAAGSTAQCVVQLNDDRHNPINGQRLLGYISTPQTRDHSGSFRCDGTTATLPATASRPQLDGAVLCEARPNASGEGELSFSFLGTNEFQSSEVSRTFIIDPAPALAPPPPSLSRNDPGQAQQGLSIEPNDEAPALAPPPPSLTMGSTPSPGTSTSTQAPPTNTQAAPMTPLQMAQQTVASFSPSQLATMTPQQLSGAVASMLSPQQMASMSITDRLQVTGLIQQLIASSVRAKLAAAGIGG